MVFFLMDVRDEDEVKAGGAYSVSTAARDKQTFHHPPTFGAQDDVSTAACDDVLPSALQDDVSPPSAPRTTNTQSRDDESDYTDTILPEFSAQSRKPSLKE
jgi:hypothetical protein